MDDPVGEFVFSGDFSQNQGISLGIRNYLLTCGFGHDNVPVKPARAAQEVLDKTQREAVAASKPGKARRGQPTNECWSRNSEWIECFDVRSNGTTSGLRAGKRTGSDEEVEAFGSRTNRRTAPSDLSRSRRLETRAGTPCTFGYRMGPAKESTSYGLRVDARSGKQRDEERPLGVLANHGATGPHGLTPEVSSGVFVRFGPAEPHGANPHRLARWRRGKPI